MIYPTRPIREVDSFTKNYDYYDSEKVIQEDGRTAVFSISNHTKNDGWKFDCYFDQYEFRIWTDEDHTKMWDNKITFEQVLLKSVVPHTQDMIVDELGKDFEIGENEELFRYQFGGALSSRWGWFITTKDNINKILRSKQTKMS